jgi:hypothetical protein
MVVMPSLTLKDIPDDLLHRLREAAERERRSLTQQALVLIEGGLARIDTVEARAERQLEAWSELSGEWKSKRSMKAEMEEIYAARSAGRDVDL